MASENSGGGRSKVVQNANTREDRVATILKKAPTDNANTREDRVTDTYTPFKKEDEETDKIPLNTSGEFIYAVPATPTTIAAAIIAPPPPPVKTAPIDTVLFDDEGMDIEVIKDLIFEDIGGHELINIARNDIVNGQQVSYQPIKNLSSIQQQYNPNNILSLQSTSDKYFANFSIKLENKIPDPGTGPSGAYVYLDNDTGDLIIEAINLETDEQIQVEITTSGTIYEAEFGEVTS